MLKIVIIKVKKLITLLLILSLGILTNCSKDDFRHSVPTLIGSWKIKQIEIRDNIGNHILSDCKAPNNYSYSVNYIDLEFQNEETAVFTFVCYDTQSVVSWVLLGEDISFYTSGSSLHGKIILAQANAMVIQFELNYKPLYYYEKE